MLRLAAAAALLLAPAPALAWQAFQTDSGQTLHWTTVDHRYRIDANLPDHFDPTLTAQIIDEAFQQWADLPCRPMTFTSEGYATGARVDPNDGVNWIRWVHDDWPLSSALIAVTWVHFDTRTGEIENVDFDFNLAQKPFLAAPVCDPASGAYDLAATMTHEVGHFLGLDHSAVAAATMFQTTRTGDCEKRILDDDDLAGFCAIYEALPAPSEDLGTDAPDAGGGGDAAPGPGGGGRRKEGGCAGGGAGGAGAGALAGISLLASRATGRGRRRPAPSRAR